MKGKKPKEFFITSVWQKYVLKNLYLGDFTPLEIDGHILNESIFLGIFCEYFAKDKIVANQSEMYSNLKEMIQWQSKNLEWKVSSNSPFDVMLWMTWFK